MRYFIVHAHHEPQSFNGSLTRHAVELLTAAGHEVQVSDLYAMKFDPVSDRRNYLSVANPDYLKQGAEDRYASAHDGFVPELRAEMEKVDWCDALIFQMPLWWFGMPAILKGWVDRVFAAGRMYGDGKWYENGVGKGKRALLSMSTGGGASIYSDDGLNPKLHAVVTPIQHGVFWYNGFAPMEPFIAWSAGWCEPVQRGQYLEDYAARLLQLFDDPPLRFIRASECDESTYRDTWPRFLVHWARTGEENGVDPALRRAHAAKLAELKVSRELPYEFLAVDRAQGWMQIRARSEEHAREIVDSLPLSSQRRIRLTRLAPSQ